jgi:hypothetical protein
MPQPGFITYLDCMMRPFSSSHPKYRFNGSKDESPIRDDFRPWRK